ncbi:MAG: Uma2 family endonuclease [Planctomyces sp.]|nr:Uma2 family endonuclease [Planctomyces sp.]
MEIDGKAEIIDGGIFVMSPASAWHTLVATKLGRYLDEYASEVGRGVAVGDNATFRCDFPHRQSLSPDAAYYLGPPAKHRPFPTAPIFAVEIRSDDDYGPRAEQRMAEKRQDYFKAGTLVVWDIDLHSHEVVRVYRSDMANQPTIYRDTDVAEAEPAVPGWSIAVRKLLPSDWEFDALI